MCASTSWPGSTRSTSACTLPPLGLVPKRRPDDLGVVEHQQVPGCSSAGSWEDRSTGGVQVRRPAGASAARRSRCCAISSGGSEKIGEGQTRGDMVGQNCPPARQRVPALMAPQQALAQTRAMARCAISTRRCTCRCATRTKPWCACTATAWREGRRRRRLPHQRGHAAE